MAKRVGFIVVGVGLAAVTLLAAADVVSQEKATPQAAGDNAMEEMMAKWLAANTKGPEHKKFEQMVGTWEVASKTWMFPGSEPTVSGGVAEFRLLFDGRYVEQRYKCDFGGQPFEGLGIEGYDNVKKKYVSIWLDNMSTGIFTSLGTTDESGKVTTYYGEMDDPITGQKDKVAKSIAREITSDKVIFESYDTRPGVGEFKTMEITYSRRK